MQNNKDDEGEHEGCVSGDNTQKGGGGDDDEERVEDGGYNKDGARSHRRRRDGHRAGCLRRPFDPPSLFFFVAPLFLQLSTILSTSPSLVHTINLPVSCFPPHFPFVPSSPFFFSTSRSITLPFDVIVEKLNQFF